MSHHVLVTGLRPHTKSFSQEARDDLGIAIARAREAAGHKFRPSFAKDAGISTTSLWKLETGHPVTASTYEAAARALPRWTEETPVQILNGEDPPPTEPLPEPDPVPDDEDSHDPDEELIRTIRDFAAKRGVERAGAAFARAIQPGPEAGEADRSQSD